MGPAGNVLQIIINGTNNSGPAFASVARGATAMGATVAAAFTAAAFRAGKFEEGLTEISTLLDGDVSASIERTRSEILQMSTDFGQSLGKMTKARYDIISAGFTNAADSAVILKNSSKLAVAGVSDVAATSDLLTTAINGLGLEASDSGRVVDVLFQTVRKGKTTIPELARSFGPVFSSARVARVGLEELGAAMATITANGIDTTEAATALNNLLRSLAAPSGEAKDALDDLGINLDRGLLPALVRLGEVGDDGLEALARLIPNIRALKAAASAAVDVDKLNGNLQAMNEASGEVDRGFEKMQATFSFQLRSMRSALDALVVEIGTMVLPAFTKFFSGARDAAAMTRFLMGSLEDGTPRWKAYGEAIRDDLLPYLNAILWPIKQVKNGIRDINAAMEENKRKERRAVIKEGMVRAGMLEQFTHKGGPFNLFDQVDWDAFNAYADRVLQLQDMLLGRGSSANEKTIFQRLGDDAGDFVDDVKKALAQVRADMARAARDAVPREDIIKTGFGEKAEPQMQGPARPKMVKQAKESSDALDDLKKQIASLAKFTMEDFSQMAFSVGDAFGNILGDVGATILHLRSGPLMLGKAFKSMAAGVVSDIARIIARLLVAKAIMASFGGGGIFGFITKGLGMMYGGTVPRAALGYSAPRATPMPPIILPGSPGLDRTMVLARGGEMMIAPETVNATQKMLGMAQSSPRRRSAGRGKMRVELVTQVNRPYRQDEQSLLTTSVKDAFRRSERHSA